MTGAPFLPLDTSTVEAIQAVEQEAAASEEAGERPTALELSEEAAEPMKKLDAGAVGANEEAPTGSEVGNARGSADETRRASRTRTTRGGDSGAASRSGLPDVTSRRNAIAERDDAVRCADASFR
ncbi:MAG: hypothetical protein R3B99_36060 [Polyangiales bacterium]